MDKQPHRDSITIRSYPKVIFLYPVMLASFLCGILQSLNPENESLKDWAGFVFFVVFSLNLMVIAFEFTRFRTLSIVFFFFGLFFFLLYLNRDFEVFPWIRDVLGNLHIHMSTPFYFCIGFYFVCIFVAVYFSSRFNFWVIKSNEILHKEGFLGDVRRFPSPNLRMNKEISDVFEFLLLGSGRIVLSPASEKQSIVLDHVLRVNTVEKRIQELLSRLAVDITHDHEDEPEPAGPAGI